MPSAGGAVNDGNVERQCLRPCAEQSGHIVEVVLACLNQVVGDDAPRFAETRVVGHGEVIGPALFLKRLRRGGRWRVAPGGIERSEEHTSELQSRLHLVCRLLLEKKKKNQQDVLTQDVGTATHAP